MDLTAAILEREQRPGRLIVLSGPSGVGKDTILRRLKEVCPKIEQCVTYTTRAPRPGETPGVDYVFVSPDEFQRMVEGDEFLEHARVHLDSYGSPLAPVMETRRKGLDALLKIDVQGGLVARKRAPDAVLIFIAPPSLEELERRLRDRYTDSETAIAQRLSDARKEIEHIPMYDYLVVNDEVESAVEEIRCIIIAERARIEYGTQHRTSNFEL